MKTISEKSVCFLFFCFISSVIFFAVPAHLSLAVCDYDYGYCCGSCLTTSCGSTCVSGNTCYYSGGLCGFHNCFWSSTCNYYCYDNSKPSCNNGCEYCPSCPGWTYSTGAYISCDSALGWKCNRDSTWCSDSGCCIGGCDSSGCTLTPRAPRSCGNCGTQTCQSNCTWGACTGQGCAPGSTQPCGNCGSQTCQADCTWGTCTEGDCSPGEVENQSCGSGDCVGNQQRTCRADCSWSGWSGCDSEGNSCGVYCGSCVGGICGGEGECQASQSSSPECPCPADECVGNDYYDYPDFGDCDSSCSCQECVPVITYDDHIHCIHNSDPVASVICCPDGCNPQGSCSPGSCTGFTSSNFCLGNDSTDPDGEGDIVYSSWNIYGWGANPDSDCSGKCGYTPQALARGGYTAELRVEDMYSAFSTTSKSFTIIQDADADFQCAYMVVGPWLPCGIFGASAGTIVYFKDASTPSELGTAIVRRDWYFEDGTPASDVGNNATFTSSFFTLVDVYSGNVTLHVEDDVGRTSEEEHQILLKRRTPEWYEVSP